MKLEIEIEIDKLVKSPLNSREDTDTSYIDLSKGMIYPPICREAGIKSGTYEVVVGWTRVLKAIEDGWKTIIIQVRHLTDEEAKQLDLISNYQRKALSPIEEGKSFKQSIKIGLSVKDIAGSICKSVAYVYKRLQLLVDLHPDILSVGQITTDDDKTNRIITFSKAREIMRLPKDEQLIVADKIQKRGYTEEGVRKLIKKADRIHDILWSIRSAKVRLELVEKYDNRRWDWDITTAKLHKEIGSRTMVEITNDKKRLMVALPTRESQFYKAYSVSAEGFSEEEAEEYAKKHNGYYVKKVNLSFHLVDVELSDEMCLNPTYFDDFHPIEMLPALIETSSILCEKCGKPIEKRMMKATPNNIFCASCIKKEIEN